MKLNKAVFSILAAAAASFSAAGSDREWGLHLGFGTGYTLGELTSKDHVFFGSPYVMGGLGGVVDLYRSPSARFAVIADYNTSVKDKYRFRKTVTAGNDIFEVSGDVGLRQTRLGISAGWLSEGFGELGAVLYYRSNQVKFNGADLTKRSNAITSTLRSNTATYTDPYLAFFWELEQKISKGGKKLFERMEFGTSLKSPDYNPGYVFSDSDLKRVYPVYEAKAIFGLKF